MQPSISSWTQQEFEHLIYQISYYHPILHLTADELQVILAIAFLLQRHGRATSFSYRALFWEIGTSIQHVVWVVSQLKRREIIGGHPDPDRAPGTPVQNYYNLHPLLKMIREIEEGSGESHE